jgi:methyl-accepting chemotaxis protein
MFKNSSLKKKLLMAFSLVSVFVLVVAGIGYFAMKKVQGEYSYISDVIMDNVKKVGDLNDAGHEANRAVLRAYISYSSQDSAGVLRYYDLFKGDNTRIEGLNKDYRSTPFSPGEEPLYENAWKHWQQYSSYAEQYFDYLKSGNGEEAKKILDNNIRPSSDAFRSSFDELMKFQDVLSKDKIEMATEAFSTASFFSTVFSAAGLIVSLITGILFSNSLSHSMSKFSDDILSSSEQTAAASEQLTASSSQLSQGATESAASLEETVSSLEELSSMVKLNSNHAQEANAISQRSLSAAETGENEITKLIGAMQEMSKSSKKIEEIINVIDDIAFQTNLLALNAAVEAARAGEQGKGFAVVADAVRNLAQRSASAAKDINTLIKENVEKTDEGVHIADSSGEALKEIVGSVKKVADLNSEISAASQEQANGIEQISKAMNHLDQAIQSNASSSESVASAATEMSSQAESLSELVTQMKQFVGGSSELMNEENVRSIKTKTAVI